MDSLEERKLKAEEEYQELLKWAIKEEDNVREKLKASGKLKEGLDSNSEYYKYIYETLNKRTREIILKYDLPNKSKWI